MLNYPFSSHSWTLLSHLVAIKHADPSLLKEKKTGIPKKISHFFPVENMIENDKIQVSCRVGDIEHQLQIELTNGRLRLGKIPIPKHFPSTGSLIFYFENKNLSLTFSDNLIDYDYNSKLIKTTDNKIIKTRIKQAEFRQNVISICNGTCFITGVQDTSVLIASHIKSWAESNPQERVDGHNGLLLSPHIDKLFDNHLISFDYDGSLLISNRLDPTILDKWAIPRSFIGRFTPRQQLYINIHREKFKEKG